MIFKTLEKATSTVVVTNYLNEKLLTKEEKEFVKSIEKRQRETLKERFDEDYDRNYDCYLTEKEEERLIEIIERIENLEDEEEIAVDYGIDLEIIETSNYNIKKYKTLYLENEEEKC